MRTLSFSEVSTALDCMARWDFRYGGHLAGDALRPKRVAPQLSAGRAWGAAVAAFHSPAGGTIEALDASLEQDAERQRESGVYDEDAHLELRAHLLKLAAHYVHTAERFTLEAVEEELLVPIPSRTGRRSSSRYRLLCYVDGFYETDRGAWLVEFKLRKRLSSVEQIALSRQIRWYAWAYWRATGTKVAGVEVIERWNEAPVPPRVLQSGKLSHAKDQLCTAEAYRHACSEYDEEPKAETLEGLERRRWQQRVPILFRDGELEEVGEELVTAAKIVQQLDSGDFLPLRNPGPVCGWCDFREICPAPDSDLVDALYERTLPKRNRTEEEASV